MKHCVVCRSTKDIQFHHVRHVRKGKVTGFLQIMNLKNRKQIPCCMQCHRKIHKGFYANLAFNDISDQELLIL
jgi:hypothetical protein